MITSTTTVQIVSRDTPSTRPKLVRQHLHATQVSLAPLCPSLVGLIRADFGLDGQLTPVTGVSQSGQSILGRTPHSGFEFLLENLSTQGDLKNSRQL